MMMFLRAWSGQCDGDVGSCVDSNYNQWTPLDLAASKGWTKTCSVLLDNDAPVDPTDKNKVRNFTACLLVLLAASPTWTH